VTGLYGGVFDPPHNGHVALAKAALDRFEFQRFLVLVVVEPGHKAVALPFEHRFELARLAFGGLPNTEVVPEGHARTVDALREHERREKRFADALFLVGADEFAGFLSWKDPDAVLELVRLGVATRPGYPRGALDAVLAKLARPERVEFFDIPAVAVSSRDLRARLAAGKSIDGLVPEAVAREIEKTRLYR
jgi:nicotinate-nucleotide adenylyltransferase